MYLAFFNLREFPFATGCDERFFFESAIHAEALANMLYTVQQRKGMVLITGEVGAGKTLLSNVLASRLGLSAATAALRHPPSSARQLLRAVAEQFDLRVDEALEKLPLVGRIREHLSQMHHRGRLAAAILDEVQDYPDMVLEEVRLMWNWEEDAQRLLQLVLIGQPELRQRIAQPQWEPLRQRIVLSYHLGPLGREDTARYIHHRLAVAAAGEARLRLTDEAMGDIYEATRGIPRLINTLCDNALLTAYARDTHAVDRPIVRSVLRDMTCWSLQSPPPTVEASTRSQIDVGALFGPARRQPPAAAAPPARNDQEPKTQHLLRKQLLADPSPEAARRAYRLSAGDDRTRHLALRVMAGGLLEALRGER
jgi:general secretion pathway protein A